MLFRSDVGVGVAADRFGNIVALGTVFAGKTSPTVGIREFATAKLNRFIFPTGDDLPDGITGVNDSAEVSLAGTPAISSSGVLAAKLTYKSGAKV